jgi:hypothetical protein
MKTEDENDLHVLQGVGRVRGFVDRNFRPFASVMLSGLGVVGACALIMFKSHVEDIGDKRWVQIEHYENQRLLDLKDRDVNRAKRDAEVEQVKQQGARTEAAIKDLSTHNEASYNKLFDAIDRLKDARYFAPPAK